MGTSIEIADGKGTVTFCGELSVRDAGEIKNTMIHALEESNEIVVDFGSVTSVDLAVLQLMCSSHRTATFMKKSLNYSGMPADAYRQAMEEAGYSRTAGCSLDCTKSCIWVLK